MTTPADLDALIATLPPSIRAVIAALGLNEAVRFLLANGGQHVHLPRQLPDNWLGLDTYQTANLRINLHDERINSGLPSLLNEFGGITLPKADKILIRLRDIEIRQQTGEQRNRLAAKYNLTVRHIWNILNDEHPDQTSIPWD